MNEAKMVVACISDEYAQSENCKLEFRFAHVSLKLPIVKAVVGLGNEWRKHEIAFLGGIYPEINFQHENSSAFQELLSYVKIELEKINEKKKQSQTTSNQKSKVDEDKKAIDNNNTAYQELYELTQRKFLKQLAQFCEKMETSKPYPKLFCIDFLDESKLQVYNRTQNKIIEYWEKI
jgi:hypothetical protein